MLSAELQGAAAEDEESLCDAAAAVLLQASRLDGATPAQTRDALLRSFSSLHGVPPETLALWRVTPRAPDSLLSRSRAQGEPVALGRRRGAGPRYANGGAGVRCALAERHALCCAAADAPPAPGEKPQHAAADFATLSRTLAVEVLCEALRRPGEAQQWLAEEAAAPLNRDARRSLQRHVESFVEAEKVAAEANAAKMAKVQSAAMAAARANAAAQQAAQARRQAAAPPPPAAPVAAPPAPPAVREVEAAPPAKEEAPRSPPPTAGERMMALYHRARSAAVADPETAIACALLSGCALYAMFADRGRYIGRAYAGVLQLAQMAGGGGVVGALSPALA